MRLLLLLFFSGYSLMVYGQRKYHCEFKEMIMFAMPDSLSKSVRGQIEEQGIPPEVAEQLAGQLASQLNLPGLLTSCLRKVDAGPDSTFILVTRNNENDGNVKLKIPDTKLLFGKGEI